jgi:lipopolysaccharide/colanic/teichoic acid biosynthesis glycosyltransferase
MTPSAAFPPSARDSDVLRRAIDVVIVLAAAPFVLVLLGILVVLIKLDTPGPIFFRDRRLGYGGRPVTILKLRTMVENAEELKASLRHLSVLPWPDFKIPNDPRITRIGRRLRRSSLDELPQLWNVLCGDLTLVGPRPSRIPIEEYELWQTERLEARPGLFGRWQFEGRARVDFAERCRMDIRQVRDQSILHELQFAYRTVASVATGKGAS